MGTQTFSPNPGSPLLAATSAISARPARSVSATRFAASVLLALTSALLVGCGSEEPTSEASTRGTGDGAALYEANCASCHGSDLRGTAKGPSQLSIVYEPNHHGDAAFRSAIAVGAAQHHWNFGDMPPVPGLDRDEVDEIVAYVRSVQEREGFER